ncbi:MAG: hypothetical protein ABSE62_01845 [Chthoniobacteraceae bacterium]|jgi:type II secretory pathway pseudopilin PulG
MRPALRTKSAARAGFTLFEICLAIFIAMLIVLAAVPSVSGVIEEQRAKKLFTEFDALTKQASSRASTERRPYALVWDDSGVTMQPLTPQEGDEPQPGDRVEFGEKLAPDLLLPAALTKNPPAIWTFWPTGTCEPATIISHVPGATWTATYDPLTEQPTFTSP